MRLSRRALLQVTAAGTVAGTLRMPHAIAQAPVAGAGVDASDRVFIANEDSNTLSVIDPRSHTIDTTVNLTSFDEDPRPPFRFVTGGVTPAHAAMIHKPLYHGAIDIHGAVPPPDNRLVATVGRGSSNVYFVDTVTRRVVGNTANPQAGPTTNGERLTSGVLLGREPHEPTFSRNGKELWVTVRGEDRLAVLDVAAALRESGGTPAGAVRAFVPTINGPAQVWFSADGSRVFVVSQKTPRLNVILLDWDAQGHSKPTTHTVIDISGQDAFGFTPFLKTSPDGRELWMSHKLADAVSARDAGVPTRLLDVVPLGAQARPNHLEFVENARGKAIYVSLARVDDGGPGGVASSRLAVIDASPPPGARKVVGTVFTHGREAHGLWVNPAGTLLYVAHEQDELPRTPAAGQTVASAFDVSHPLAPVFVAQVALGALALPSGPLRNKKSINLVYVRPGARSQTA